MTSDHPPESTDSIRFPGLWVVVVGVHIAAAAYAWQMLPHGFSADHPRFWTNQLFPFAIVALGAACVFGLWRRRARLVAIAISVFAGIYVAMTVAWIVVFPITGKRPALMTAAVAVVLLACAAASLWRARGTRVPGAIGAVIGLLIGSALPWSQRGADAQTRPTEPARSLGSATTVTPAELPSWIRASPETATLVVESGTAVIELHPLLTFLSRSPDRGWTLLADAEDRIGPARRYAGTSVDGATTTYHYAGDEPAVLRVASSDGVLRVEAESVLPAAVYSHLNYFCAMAIRGHRRLFLAFSAIPAQRIEVTYSEYPVGRPSRFAYVDAARVLHVVEAESGEKGPFTELARGPLPAGAALGITLFDEAQPIARIELADFAAQASTQPSPTAGWDVPENAIEFSLNGNHPDAAARLYITLAGTSVGRGFDSVGHAPGLYRNRIEIHRTPAP